MNIFRKIAVGVVILAGACLAGCALTDRLGLTDYDGTERTVSDAAVEMAEQTAGAMSEQGGILGVIGTALAGAIAVWKSRRATSNAAKAQALAQVLAKVIQKAEDCKEAGGNWTPTEEELKAIVAKVASSAELADVLATVGVDVKGAATQEGGTGNG